MACNIFNNIATVIFDLDGTIYFGDKTLAPKANEVITLSRKKFNHIFFATNNSAVNIDILYKRLTNLGILVNKDEIINAGYLIIRYLKLHNIKSVYCLGTDILKNDLEKAGIEISSNSNEAIVIGYDSEFNLSKLEKAINVCKQNLPLIIANKERTYPRENGILAPGTGAIVNSFECCTGFDNEVIIGKPSVEMLNFISNKLKLKPENIMVIGDSIESDMMMAKNFGAKSIYIRNNKPINENFYCINELQELLEIM